MIPRLQYSMTTVDVWNWSGVPVELGFWLFRNGLIQREILTVPVSIGSPTSVKTSEYPNSSATFDYVLDQQTLQYAIFSGTTRLILLANNRFPKASTLTPRYDDTYNNYTYYPAGFMTADCDIVQGDYYSAADAYFGTVSQAYLDQSLVVEVPGAELYQLTEVRDAFQPSNNGGQGGAPPAPPPESGGSSPPPGDDDPPATGGDNPPSGGDNPPATGGDDPPSGGDDPPAGGGDDPPSGDGNPPPEGGGDDPPSGGDDPLDLQSADDSSSWWWLLVVVVLAVFMALGVGGLYLYRRRQRPETA